MPVFLFTLLPGSFKQFLEPDISIISVLMSHIQLYAIYAYQRRENRRAFLDLGRKIKDEKETERAGENEKKKSK